MANGAGWGGAGGRRVVRLSRLGEGVGGGKRGQGKITYQKNHRPKKRNFLNFLKIWGLKAGTKGGRRPTASPLWLRARGSHAVRTRNNSDSCELDAQHHLKHVRAHSNSLHDGFVSCVRQYELPDRKTKSALTNNAFRKSFFKQHGFEVE